MKIVMKDILLKLMFNILKNCITFTMIYHFYLVQNAKAEKVQKLIAKLHNKNKYFIHIRNKTA